MSKRIERMAALEQRVQEGTAAGMQPGAGVHFRMEGDIAIVGLCGVMLPEVSLVDEYIAEVYGESSTSTLRTTEKIKELTADPSVKGIMIAVDSPGGVSTGVPELGDAIAAAAEVKPVHAYAPSIAASAGYWAPAQATRFTIGRSAEAGSIGAYTVVYDISKAFETAGYEANVFSTGGVKGAGVMGAKLTDEQRADIQRNIDALGNLFVEAVAAGRELPKPEAKALATGQVWMGHEAVGLGLADAVEDEDTAIANLKQVIASASAPAPGISTASAQLQASTTSAREPNMKMKDILAKLEAGDKLAAEELAFLKQETTPIVARVEPIEARADIPEDVRAQLAAERIEREKLAAEVATLKAKEQRSQYMAEASNLKHVPGLTVEEIADQLPAADKSDKSIATKLRQHLNSVNAAMKSSKMFETFGSSVTQAQSDTSPMGQLKSKASALKTVDPTLSDAAAFTKACELNPELYLATRKGEV